MACPRFPQGKLREIIERTIQTGNEHGFVRCADGSTSQIVSGDEGSMNIEPAMQQCNLNAGPVEVVHTHPNGNENLSNADRDVAASDEVDAVCATTPDGKMRCEAIASCNDTVEQ